MKRAWAVAGAAKWEYEVDAEVAYTFKLRNADHLGLPVNCGVWSQMLRLFIYENHRARSIWRCALMDVGAEYETTARM